MRGKVPALGVGTPPVAAALSSRAVTEERVLTRADQLREAYRAKPLRQAMYTAGAVVMADCLLDLHGDEHRRRRRLENRLFRRETFARWERELLAGTIDATLGPFVAAGRGDLLVIGYRAAMSLTATIAGIDHDPTDDVTTDRLYEIVTTFSAGATLVHSTRDRAEVEAEVRAAVARFTTDFYEPSRARRQAQLDRGGDPPGDVLAMLLAHGAELDLSPEVIRREICFYLQAGAHSTANAFTHTLDELFAWGIDHPADLAKARRDRAFVQRCVHESLRLNPASPVAWRTPLEAVRLDDGTELPAGCRVVLDIAAANRDPELWGPGADRFDPYRVVPEQAMPWGFSFGGGMHACIGMELDGGVELPGGGARSGGAGGAVPGAEHLFGTVAVMVSTVLAAGARPDPEAAPTLDPHSSRRHFSRYPVVFG